MPISKGGGGGGSGGAVKYAKLTETQASNTAGGGAATGAWTTRVLNTIDNDPGSIISSLTSNAFTVAAGSYVIEAWAPFSHTQRTRLRLFNQTDSSVIALGSSFYSAEYNRLCPVFTVVTFTGAKAVRVEYFAASNVDTGDLGLAQGLAATSEVYTTVQVWKIG